MTKWIERTYALSHKGATGLEKAVVLTILCNLSLMLPVSVSLLAVRELLNMIDGEAASVLPLTGIAIIVLALIWVLHYMQYPTLYINTYEESSDRRIRMAEHLRKLPLSFFSHRNLSDVTQAIVGDCAELDQMFSHYIPQTLATAVSTLVIAVMMACIDWRMALAALWVVPIAVLFPVIGKRLQDREGTANIKAKLATANHIQQTLETIREIRACNMEDKDASAFRLVTANQVRHEIRNELVSGIFVSAGFIVLKLGIASTVITGTTLLLDGRLSLLYFIGFMAAAVMVYNPIDNLLQNISATFSAKLRIKRVKAVIDSPVQEGSKCFTPQGHDITFDHVSFSYESGKSVLKDLSFTAKEGEVTALVGPSGGGKTTACRLAERFWDVDEGRILVGGVDISTVDPEVLLTHYSSVFQDVTLFNDTIMENIRLGRKGASDEDVIRAARAAQCDDFIKTLPDGYDTVLSENGASLSGGERQRISIARALLKEAPIILLDEATASLDVESESEVQKAISALTKDKTVLVIAHRLRTVINADHILVLANGRIEEEGPGRSLMEAGGRFAQMAALQSGLQSWTVRE